MIPDPDRIEPRISSHPHPHDPDYVEPMSAADRALMEEMEDQRAGERYLDRLEQREMGE